jgi:hypothetical protein
VLSWGGNAQVIKPAELVFKKRVQTVAKAHGDETSSLIEPRGSDAI